jgi:hypothetical protein
MRLHHSAARLMLKIPVAVCRMGFFAPAKSHFNLKDQEKRGKLPVLMEQPQYQSAPSSVATMKLV